MSSSNSPCAQERRRPGTGSGRQVPVNGNCNAKLNKDILFNCVLPSLWKNHLRVSTNSIFVYTCTSVSIKLASNAFFFKVMSPPPMGIGTVLKWLQSYKLRKSISRQNGTFRILHHNLFHIKVQFTLFIENHLALLTSHSSRIKGKHRCALQERHAVTLYRLPSFNIHSHAHTVHLMPI